MNPTEELKHPDSARNLRSGHYSSADLFIILTRDAEWYDQQKRHTEARVVRNIRDRLTTP